jgi:hypothetical protein
MPLFDACPCSTHAHTRLSSPQAGRRATEPPLGLHTCEFHGADVCATAVLMQPPHACIGDASMGSRRVQTRQVGRHVTICACKRGVVGPASLFSPGWWSVTGVPKGWLRQRLNSREADSDGARGVGPRRNQRAPPERNGGAMRAMHSTGRRASTQAKPGQAVCPPARGGVRESHERGETRAPRPAAAMRGSARTACAGVSSVEGAPPVGP